MDNHFLPNWFVTHKFLSIIKIVICMRCLVVGAHKRQRQSLAVGFGVIVEQIVPTDFLRLLFGLLAKFCAIGGGHFVHCRDYLRQIVNHFPVIVFGAVQDLNSIDNSGGAFLHPLSESGQTCGYCWHAHGNTLERCVAPRLVVRREGRQIEAAQKVVVRHIENAVVAVQVNRNQHHVHLLPLIVSQLQLVSLVHYGVVIVGVERVRCNALVGHANVAVGQTVLQTLARTVVEVRHQNESNDIVFEIVLLVEFAKRVDKYVDTLVFELVAARNCHKQRLVVAFVAGERLCHFGQALASVFGHVGVHLRQVVECESVRCNGVGLVVEQHLALVGRHLTNGCVNRSHLCGCFLERVFGHYAKFACANVGVERAQALVERESVAGHRAAKHRGMRGKHCCHLRAGAVEIKHARTCLPLVELRNHRRVGQIEVLVTLHHLAGCVSEQHRLNILPLTRYGIEFVGLPPRSQQFVFQRNKHCIIDKHSQRFVSHVPAAHLYAQAFFFSLLAPFGEQALVFSKLMIALFSHQIGADEHHIVAVSGMLVRHFRSYHSVDSTHLVANFPTGFKQERWLN